jgi:hypothetical protein
MTAELKFSKVWNQIKKGEFKDKNLGR